MWRGFAQWIQQRNDRDVTPESQPVEQRVVVSKLPGDPRSLRGIPAIGRGVGGTQPGTNPADVNCWPSTRAANSRRSRTA